MDCFNRWIVKAKLSSLPAELNDPQGSLAQLGEHLPYKQRVSGSIPLTPMNKGNLIRSRGVAVITSPCHGEDRGFDSRRDRSKCFSYFEFRC